MSKKQVMAEIIRHTSLSDGIFDMTLKAEEIAKEAKAGQFISVYLNNKSKILPRPISICEIDTETSKLRVVYRVTAEKRGQSSFQDESGRYTSDHWTFRELVFR